MTDFSFVSVEVGIPFATSEGALTIYDCNDASRYVHIRSWNIGRVPMNTPFIIVVESVCWLRMYVAGVCMEDSAVELQTSVLYQLE